MKLVKSAFALRSKSHVLTRMQIRNELAFRRFLNPWISPIYVLFAIVDWVSIPNSNFIFFFLIRIITVLLSASFFIFLRGRVRYGTRIFLIISPYLFTIQYIMLKYELTLSPYFAGIPLVLFTGITLFPMRTKIAAFVCTASVFPVLLFPLFGTYGGFSQTLLTHLMVSGGVLLSILNSSQIFNDFEQRLIASEALARDLGRRDKEIRFQSEELMKRRTFESQFSPQVVSEVLRDSQSLMQMQQKKIAVIVIDIENSTGKANTLAPAKYKEVIEEAFDVFASACLKWNVTVDKFTGDGAQALSGAPVAATNDFIRALKACEDTLRMLHARKSQLELLWGDTFNVRLAVSEGKALVGFLGRGSLKSFTAIGDAVSFTHRLCGTAPTWSVAAYSWLRDLESLSEIPEGWDQTLHPVIGLKGFGMQNFKTLTLRLRYYSQNQTDLGRCPKCETPLVLEDTAGPIPKITCPGCKSRTHSRAA